MEMPVPKKNPVKGICATRFCRNKSTALLCSSCRSRKSRLSDPVRYAYYNIKHRAKERNKPFEITLEEFREFCIKTQYIAGKGRTADSFTVDRIDNEKGYTKDNIQILTLSENVRKRFLSYDYEHKVATVWEPPIDNTPNYF